MKKNLTFLYSILILSFFIGVNFGQQRSMVVYPIFNEDLSNISQSPKTLKYSSELITLSGDVFQDGADRLASLQNNDGGWDWFLDDGDPNTGSALNTVGPIAKGLAEAYLFTNDNDHLSALTDAGSFLLTKTNNFSPSDGYLAATLDQVFGGSTYTQHLTNNFYNPLAAGTYDKDGAGILYSTATYVDYVRARRSGTQANLAAWDVGVGLVGASMCGASTTEWIDGVKAEINELDGLGDYDVIGLAGALYGLAFVSEEFDPTAGEHAAASNLMDLANILVGYQITLGGFTWNSQYLNPGEANETNQETSYAILALNEVNRQMFLENIVGAGNYLRSVQLVTGGWDNFVGDPYGENNEVTGEALWGLSLADGPIHNVTQNTYHSTIQNAVDLANPGDEIKVSDGNYIENILINKNIKLISVNGKDFTTITGIANAGKNATISVTAPTSSVQIGDVNQGFKIIGIDNGNPAIENAALYFIGGPHSNAIIKGNEIFANGDEGLLCDYNAAVTFFTIDGNIFSGQTFVGSNPAGVGFNNQFALPNVPRQLVAMGGGATGTNTHHITFTNNQIIGSAGGMSVTGNSGEVIALTEQGNTLVTIDADNSTITDNIFSGTTSRYGTSFRCRRPNLTLTGNTFNSTGLTSTTGHLYIQNNVLNPALVAANTFDAGSYILNGNQVNIVDGFTTASLAPIGSVVYDIAGKLYVAGALKIQNAINAAIDGDIIQIGPGTFIEQLSIGKSLTFIGSGPSLLPTTIITSTANPIINLTVTAKSYTFQNLIIEGNVTNNGIRAGGSININSLTLKDVIGRNCQVALYLAEYYSGGVFITTSVTNLSMDNVTLTNNKFIGAYIGKTVLSGVVTNSTFTGNGYSDDLSDDWQKTGLQFVNFDEASVPQVLVTNSTFSNNGAGASNIERTGLILYTAYNAHSPNEIMTVSGCSFSNHPQYAVRIKNGYNVGNTATVNGTFLNNYLDIWFYNIIGTTSSTTLVRNTFTGIKTVGAGPLYDFSTIQAAINAAANGDVINVAAGTYHERLTINKSLELRGAQYGVDPTVAGVRTNPVLESVIDLVGVGLVNPNVLIEIPSSITNVTISGFTLNGSPTINWADESVIRCWDDNITIQDNILDGYTGVLYKGNDYIYVLRNRITANKTGMVVQPNAATNVTVSNNNIVRGSTPGGDETGIYFTGTTSCTVNENTITGFLSGRAFQGSSISQCELNENSFTGNRDAISIFSSSTFITITQNNLSNNTRYGINIKGQDINISNNFINGNNDAGISIDKHVINTERVTIFNNDLSGNTNYGVTVNSVNVPEIINASGNWWGSNDPATVTSQVAANVDYTPWLNIGTDVGGDPTDGFQPDLSNLWVDDNSPQSGTTGRIQESVNMVSGSTVNVNAGEYEEQVTVDNKNITIQGAGVNLTSINSPATLTTTFITSVTQKCVVGCINNGNLVIKDLTVNGLGRGNANNRFVGIGFRNAAGTIQNCKILDIKDTPFSGVQHGVGIYSFNDDATSRTINVLNNEIIGFQKNAMALNAGATNPLIVNVKNNIVTGFGATNVTAQNGIQVSGDMITGTVQENTIAGIGYSGTGWVATSILNFYSNIEIISNIVTDGHVGIYNIDGASNILTNNITTKKIGDYGYGIIATDPPNAIPSPFDSPERNLALTKNGFTNETTNELKEGVKKGLTNELSKASTKLLKEEFNGLNGVSTVLLSENTITFSGPDNTSTYGIEADAGYGPDNLAIIATNNSVSGFGVGVGVYQCETSCDIGVFTNIDFNNNNIFSNTIGFETNLALTVLAKNNWWGNSSGPYHSTLNPTGTGNAVSDGVDFDPWIGKLLCPSGIVSYLNLDEISGSTYVDIVGANNGTSSIPPIPAAGRVGGAQQFNGNTTVINIASNSIFDFDANEPFTLEAWINHPTASVPLPYREVIVGRRDPSTSLRWYIGIETDGKPLINLTSTGGTNATVKAGRSVLDGKWHHIVGTRDPSTGNTRIYLDGVRMSTGNKPFPTGFTSATAPVQIGWLVNNNYGFQGRIDEVAIYNTVLPEAEIAEHYNSGLAGQGYCGESGGGSAAPVITSTPITSGQVSQLYSYDVEATGNPVPTYSLIIFPSGMNINTTTGLIEWTPGLLGDFNVTVQAENGVNPPASQTFVITVSGTAPAITSTPVTAAQVGQLYSYDVNAIGNPAPTYSLTTFPIGMTINTTTGLIEWTPGSAGDNNVTVQASNGVNPPASQTFVITVEGVICPPGIISYWKLDETTTGSYADFVGTNAGTSSIAPTPATGRVGGAQQFNGSTTVINIGANSVFDFDANEPFTLEAWINHPTVSVPLPYREVIVGRRDPSTSLRLYIGIETDGKPLINLTSTGGTNATVKAGRSVLDGRWHHIVGTRDPSTGNTIIYLDGVRVGTGNKPFPTGFTSATAPVQIGWLVNNNYGFQGRIDEVAIYNTVLPEAEIAEHYTSGLGGQGYCQPGFTKVNSSTPSSVFESFAAFNDNNIISLSWTISEEATYGFEIQSSLSQDNSWEKIVFINASENRFYDFQDKPTISEGELAYRIKLINKDGGYAYSSEVTVQVLPVEFKLYQNYPNPFNPVTNIRFDLPKPGKVRLDVYNIIGEQVTTLLDKDMEAGYHNIPFNASNLPSGVYIYKLQTEVKTDVKKMMFLK